MQLFLIRHGETEHNIAGLLAGVTDSCLTNHGVLQTQRLGSFLIQNRKLTFNHVYASDLRRAFMTAEEICKAQNSSDRSTDRVNVVKLALLREQDFGSFELVPWSSKRAPDSDDSAIPSQADPDFRPKETKQAMTSRANEFLDDFILPLLAFDLEEENYVAIVSHGLFLGSLWRALLDRFSSRNVSLASEEALLVAGRPLQHLGSWANTGYLEVQIAATATDTAISQDNSTSDKATNKSSFRIEGTLTVKSINSRDHLQNLKRTRGGLGSATFDERQPSISTYFKKRKSSRIDEKAKKDVG